MNYGLDMYDREHRPVLRGEDVSGLDIKSNERAGTDQRERAAAHVENMLAGGFITGDEAGKRRNYIENAATVSQVNAAIADLPAMPAPKRFSWKNPYHAFPALVALLAAFVTLVVTGGVILSHTTAAAAEIFGGGLLSFGIVGTMAVFVTLIAKIVIFIDG